MQETGVVPRLPADIPPNRALYSRQATTLRASLIGLGAMIALALAILIGSRMLAFFDPALTGYAIASLFGANLGGSETTITISNQPATILYASPGQVNLVIPPTLKPGPAVLRKSRSSRIPAS